MYQVPSDKLKYFEEQINDVNRQIVYRFTLNDEPLESNLIFDNPVITYDGGLTQYGVGSVVIKHLELSVHSSVFVIPTSTIKIEVGLSIYNDTTQEWEILYSPFGVFHVDDVETTGAKKVVRAYDGLFKLAKGYFPSAKHTTTTAIANDIATSNSLNVKGMTSVNIDNEQLEGKTCLQMLSLLAGATGTNVVLSRDGQTIEFVEPKETNLEFNEVDFVTPTTGEDEFNITKLVVHYSDKVTNEEGQVEDEGYYEVGEGTDRHTLELSNPLLKSNKQQATIILNKIKKMNGYKRFETTLPTADFRLDPFDIVTFHQGEDTFVIPLLFVRYTLTHRGIGLLVETTVDIPSESEFSFKGTLTQKVENIYTDIINVKDLIANKVTTDELEATIAKIEQLYVKYGEFEELVADSAIINKLQADLIEVDNIIGNLGQFENLEALVAEFQLLKAKVAEIDNLIANTILSEIIQTGSITSDMLNIRDGFIQDAMINNLSASKIHAGVLNTNNVNIQSEDGDMTLRGNLLQFKDSNGIVRIQIGKDSKGAYTFTLYDATGKGVLINQDGIQSSDAIKDGLIVNDNINDNANINAGKLDINSVFEHMNEDGSNTLKGTKIHLDATKQNLEVSFKNMTNKQTEQEETMNTLITDFNIEQGKITQLIQDTTISVDGENKKLKDVVNRTVSTVDSHTVTIGQMESTMDAQTGQLQSMNSSLTQVKQDMKGITSTVGSVQATLNQQGTALNETQKELGTSVAGVDVKYYHSTSNTQLIGGSWQNTAPSYVEGKYIWTKTITTLKDGTVRESSPTCLSGTNGKDGANGSDGKGVKNIEEYYAVSTSNTQAPTNWLTTVPIMTSTNKYLWNYEVITYTDNSTKSTAKRVIGVYGDKGQNGVNGANGQDGKGIKSITNYYLATNSSSGVTTSTSGWTTTVQSPTRDKKYLWNYEKVTYTDNSTTNTTPCVIGNFAQDGMNGSNGSNGADAYTVILSNENHTFPCESNGNIPTAINATTSIIAYKGATSVTPTIGTLPTVNGLTLSKSGTTVTIQANTGTALASSGSLTIPVTVDGKNFNKVFSWSKAFKGANGASGSNAKSADIVSTSQVFKSTDGGVTFTPDNITLTPILQNVSFSKWQYSTNGGSSWTNVSSGQNGLTVSGNNLVISKSSSLYTTSITSVSFKLITNDSNIYDTVTIVKLYDVKDMEIGGRNLILDSGKKRGGSTRASEYNINFFKNSKVIVTNPSDSFYSDYPNPPVGGVFNNIKRPINKLNRGNLDAPAITQSALTLIKLYESTGDEECYNRAKLIADYIVSRIYVGSYYGKPMPLMTSRASYKNGAWVNSVGEMTIRNTYQAMYALLRFYQVSNEEIYLTKATDLMKSCGSIYNNINKRVDEGALEEYMRGAVYEYAYDTDGKVTWSWSLVSALSADFLGEAILLYLDVVGNETMLDNEGKSFRPYDILYHFTQHVKNSINAGVFEMTNGTGLPYYFLRNQVGTNWDWVDGTGYGDVWFANDAVLWVIKGLAYIAKKELDNELLEIATRYRNTFFNLKVENSNGELLWHDRYTFNGHALDDDTSVSISATALMYDIDTILGIGRKERNNIQYETTLKNYQIKDQDLNISGSYGWNAMESDSSIEVKATSEIWLSEYYDAIVEQMLGDSDVYNLSEKMVSGKQYTISLTPSSPSASSYIEINSSRVKLEYKEKTGRACATFVADGQMNLATKIKIMSVGMTYPKLEKGSVATDWSPAPEDGIDYTDKLIDDLRKLDLKQITDQNQESSDMIANILNDSLIMPHEKTSLKFEFERIKILKENAINYYNTVNDTSFQQLRNAMNTAYTNVENMINPILTNMTQTSNASSSAVHTTFQTFYTAYETLMTALQQSVIILATKHSTKLEQLDKEITMTASKAEIMQDKVNQFDAHMRFSADGFVEIFATENGKKGRFSTQITNKKLSFKDNEVEVAYVSNQELNINKAVIKDRMSVGNFVIKPSGSSTGGIVFAYETI